jgi:hypothetical protein
MKDNSEYKPLARDEMFSESDYESRTSYSIKICGYCTQSRHSECRGPTDYSCYRSKLNYN